MRNVQFLQSNHLFFNLNNNRTQIRTALKKKAFEDAGLPVRQIATQPAQSQSQQAPIIKSEVTLNMLNAAESEVDVESLHEDVKLEFDGGNEEVSS